MCSSLDFRPSSTAALWLCPSEVLKQQLQGGLHSNTVDAVKALWARGGVRGLYQGLGGQLARDIPFRATQMTTYEVVRRAYVHGRESRLPLVLPNFAT